ncbi:MAG: VanZ family protein [Verrucomicrobia bacterium]|nr:VanZ family protein [Verrucomicrobiota bacterium]
MKWDIFLQLEQRKLKVQRLKVRASKGLAFVFLVLVLYLGFAESVATSPFWKQIDKGMHFVLFGLFTLVFLQYARHQFFMRLSNFHRLTLLFGSLILLGILSEFLQILVPKRTFEFNDMLANILGIGVFGIPFVSLIPFSRLESCRVEFTGIGSNRSEARCLKARRRPR